MYLIRNAFVLLGLGGASLSLAAVTAFERDLAGFNLAGGAGIAVDFDSVADGTAFEGMSLAGATFHGLGSALQVVNGYDTFTPGDAGGVWKLFPTTDNNVLSPGGKELSFDSAVQLDSLQITFAVPTQSFGFDLLYQSNDGFSLTGIELFDANGNSLYSNGFLPAGGGGNGGSEFYGYISDTANIARVVITDNDNDSANPDANIGYDTLRFTPSTVPEPTSMVALGLGALALLRRRRS